MAPPSTQPTTAAESSGRDVYPNKSLKRKESFILEVDQGSCSDNVVMGLFCLVMIVFTFVIIFGDALLLPRDTLVWCQAAQRGAPLKTYANVDAVRDPCYYERSLYLLGWSMFECDFGRRMIASVVLGAVIGYERKAAERPAGIRTMSLVCLGAATFTMGGQFAFRSSTMGWDAARVSAAIPSGVGFLGSALIWKATTGEKGQNQRNHVHGITTAASVWLSASVGIGAGGALYVMSVWTVVLVVFVLRMAPQLKGSNRRATVSGGDVVPKSVSYQKNFDQLLRESMRIQKRQMPALHSD
ncbi:Protein MgtC [Seminavis robusta]|uniref:Protein MgtC n=1 Tax=Seminavis robusta TaxID=568900 RepID=A0A9N8DI72_9STRA|nr:Protein MgtC [Seminavis robusta]|eukprot:Sro140_g065550.1 Protein MgtC (299) ;mRNA; f:76594-77736